LIHQLFEQRADVDSHIGGGERENQRCESYVGDVWWFFEVVMKEEEEENKTKRG
jgi:hypothetical protein